MLVNRIIPFLFLLLLEHLSFLLTENINLRSPQENPAFTLLFEDSQAVLYIQLLYFGKKHPWPCRVYTPVLFNETEIVWLVRAGKSWLNSHGSFPQCLCKSKSDAAVCIIAEALWNPLQQSSIHLWVSWDNMSGWLLCNRSTSQLENRPVSPVVVHGYAA